MKGQLFFWIIYVIIPLLGSLFLFYTLIDAMIKMGCNIRGRQKQRFIVFLLYTIASMAVFLVLPAKWVSIFSFISLVVGLSVLGHFFCNTKRIYLLYYVGLTVGTFFLDIVLSVLFQFLVQAEIIYFFQTEFYNLVYIVSSKLITFLMAKGYVLLVRKKEQMEISRKQYYSSLLLPLASIVFLYTLLYVMQIYMDESSMRLLFVNVVLLLGLNIYYPLQERSGKEALKKDFDNTWEKLQNKHYEELEEKLAQSQSILHDIRSHVQMMERLYQESASSQAQEYAKNLHQMLNDLGERYYTDNRVLNMILNDKVRRMKREGVKVRVSLRDLDFTGYKDTELTAIFGNLLENAQTAVSHCTEKCFSMHGGRVGDLMSFVLANKVEEEEKLNAYRKKGKEFRGIGLRNVERIVEKYQGEIEYEIKDREFAVKFMLPVLAAEDGKEDKK